MDILETKNREEGGRKTNEGQKNEENKGKIGKRREHKTANGTKTKKRLNETNIQRFLLTGLT
jgi:hypothetical protein